MHQEPSPTLPTEGRTVLAHVQQLLDEAAAVIERVRLAVRVRPTHVVDREQMRRDLAGVIAKCETVRLWLDAGAPQETSAAEGTRDPGRV